MVGDSECAPLYLFARNRRPFADYDRTIAVPQEDYIGVSQVIRGSRRSASGPIDRQNGGAYRIVQCAPFLLSDSIGGLGVGANPSIARR